MRVKNFSTNYNIIEHSVPLDTGKESKVERSGYLSSKQRIENMILAGRKLVDSRKEMYDDDTGLNDDIDIDPTRHPSYDMADAFQDSLALNARLKQQKKAAEAAKLAAESPKPPEIKAEKEVGQ